MRTHSSPPAPLIKSAQDYGGRGWLVLPVHTPTDEGCSCRRENCQTPGKHPRLDDWLSVASADADTIGDWWAQWPDANIGIAFGRDTGLVDIEVDPRSGGPDNLEKLEAILGPLPPTLQYVSGGGGTHSLFLYPDGASIGKATHVGRKLLGLGRDEPTGIDVISDGGQAVAPPSLHASGRRYAWVDADAIPAELPAEWIEFLAKKDVTPTARGKAEAFLEKGSEVLDDITIEKAQEILGVIDPSLDYHTWLLIGQALKVQFPYEEPEALEIFDAWSKGSSEKYPGRRNIERQWRHLGKHNGSGNVVTFRSVIKIAKECGWAPASAPHAAETSPSDRQRLRENDAALRRDFLRRLSKAIDDEDLSEITGEIRTLELFDATREALSDAYLDAFNRIHPAKKITKATATALLSDEGEREARAKELAEESAFYEPYVYVGEQKMGAFFCTKTGQEISVKVFDDLYSAHLVTPIRRAQGNISPIYLPSDLVLNCNLVEKVTGIRYMPGEERIYEENGRRYVNRYTPPLVGVSDPDLFDEREEEAIHAIISHFDWMLGKPHADQLIKFLAYLGQNPGKRVRWCYTIIGPEGIGKSFAGAIASILLGPQNVKTIGPSTLSHTNFNGWAEGHQLNVIEEIKVDGMNKWEVMNSIKASITNDFIDVHAKGQESREVRNTASFLAFTNFENALAIRKDDRRYYIAHTVFHSDAFLGDLGGEKAAVQYFRRLFGLLEEYPEAVRGWLRSVDCSDFTPERAPRTREKEWMVDASTGDLESAIGRVIADDKIDTVTSLAIDLDTLKAALEMDAEAGRHSGQAISRILRDMRYIPAYGQPIDPLKTGRLSRWYVHPDNCRSARKPWTGEEVFTAIRRLLGK